MERKVLLWEQKKATPFHYGYLKMRIALCDWDIKFLEKIKRSIYTYAEQYRMDIVADCYTCGERLLSSGINYNIIFLGYKLCGINGMKIAENIRQNAIDAAIVFISENTDFILDSFKVNPYRFLIKPISTDKIVDVLKDYFKKFGTDYPLWIKCGEDIFCLNTGDIYYLEADNKHCKIYLKNEELPCNKTMARVFSSLPKRSFSKINRAYVVNLNLVNKYNNELLTLKNGTTLHISRNYIKSFKEEFRQFMQPKEL